jgi:hypothetical protein
LGSRLAALTPRLNGLLLPQQSRYANRGAARARMSADESWSTSLTARRQRSHRADSVGPRRAPTINLRGVSKGKRSRRPSGHPAKVAVRREREAARRSGIGPGPEAIVRRIIREAGGLTGALDGELWASQLLGTFWEQRGSLPLRESQDCAVIYGAPLVEAMGRIGGGGARTALTIIAAVDDAELGEMAGEFARRLAADDQDPGAPWLAEVGEAEITAAAVMREDVFDDGFTVFLEARHPSGEAHAVGVYIDNNLGVMAKDLLLADSIDRVAEVMRRHPRDDGDLRLQSIYPAVAGAEIRAAMALTEMTLDPPVSDDYAGLRALAILRADEAPGGPAHPEREEMSAAERDALRGEFLASPEGRGFAPDGDEAFAISLVVDFCADYVDGRPLRWSPVVVELFMAGWVPRKVLADGDLLQALPAALDAWVRFAGRKRGTPEWAIEISRKAIPHWRDEMAAATSDPGSGGPAKQFLTAAKEAGIDVSDQGALTTFIAGWNARSIAP